jgi:hypothetical protein
MKTYQSITKQLLPMAFGLAALALFILPGQAQIVVSYVGYSSGSTMPGSATDFIFFTGGNGGAPTDYPNGGPSDNNGATSASQLSSFSFVGGLVGQGPLTGSDPITTPAGTLLTGTGGITGDGGAAFGVEPTQSSPVGSTFSAAEYNDFNVYVLYSNTNQTNYVDSSIYLYSRYNANPNDLTVPASSDATVTLGGTGNPPADSVMTGPTYLEFNVQGLGTAIADGFAPDLVMGATTSSSEAYVGAVSFESAPEPSTYAMLFGGLGMLIVISRFRNKLTA